MTSKLTLNLDSGLIEKAKRLSKERGKSLSEIIERFLQEFTTQEI